MKSLLIAVNGWDPEHWGGCVREELPDRQIFLTDRQSNIKATSAELASIHYALVWKPNPDLLWSLPNLELIISLGAGVDHLLDKKEIPDVPILRVVDPDMTHRMGEYIVWQVLHHHRRGPAYAKLQAKNEWKALKQPAAQEVSVGIMGMGVLGRHAASLLQRLGFPVRGWSRTAKTFDGIPMFDGGDGLTDFLGETDVLVSLLPLTKETDGLLNADLISKLRRNGPLGGPVLINAGRGGSQVAADIALALTNGDLAGASLDVFSPEPLAPDDPLWSAPNLVITPHVAAVSSPEALSNYLGRQIAAYERGEMLENVVDRARGY